jgi:eukaryotic-like serine/threonine-protein kinase
MSERELFIAARQQPNAAAQAAFLDEACAGDAELRQRVLTLLREHEHLGDFLEAPAAPPLAAHAAPAAEGPGTMIGPYKLVQPIGEGGMGTVWLAQQTEPVKRLVALKIIKPGMDSRQVIARFEAERQALALMDHPHIAKVLDGGTTSSGRPFFVMELVKGVPITRYCDEHRLTPRQRLELFIPVCQAVQHAHQKGVIHRDLKPSNVLIAGYDGRPVAKVIDFGLAKATGQPLTQKTLVTGFGALVGTLEYMSPEQAELNQQDIDTRSDIYSLGVLLYELLTGSTPLEPKRLKEATLLEVLRRIREEEPPTPSKRLSTTEELPAVAAKRGLEAKKLRGLLRGELDWIVMKCLEKDRNRRYETANGLAIDVQRYLADEPVQACPPSRWYRFRKFARRNRAALATGALVGAALVMTVLTLIGSNVRIRQEKKRAEHGFREARQAVDDYFTQISESQLLDVPGLQPLRKELLERALRYYQHFVAQQDDDPAVRAELAKAYFRVGFITFAIGSKADALTALEKARQIQESLVQANPFDMQIRVDLASTYGHIGAAQRYRGTLDDAMRSHEREQAIWEELSRANPIDPHFQSGLAGSHEHMGETLSLLGRWEESLRSHEMSREVRERLAQDLSASPRLKNDLAGSYMHIGQAQWLLHQSALALGSYGKACRVRENLVQANPGMIQLERDLAYSYRKLGECYRLDGQAAKALEAYERAYPILEKLAHNNPTVIDFQYKLAECHSGIAHTYWAKVQLTEAAKSFERALAILQTILPSAPDSLTVQFDIGLINFYLGTVQFRAGELPEASRSLQTARALYEKLAPEHPQVPTAKRLLASTYEALGDLSGFSGQQPEARGYYQNARATYEQLVHEHPKDFFLASFASFLVTCPDLETCDVQRALTLGAQVVDQSPQFAGGWDALGLAHYYADSFGKAASAFAKAVELDPRERSAWVHLGMAHYRAGNYHDARTALEKAIALHDARGAGYQWFFLAMTQWRLGNQDEAHQCYNQAVRHLEKNRTPSEELLRLRTEAAGLLGIKHPGQPTPELLPPKVMPSMK